MDSPASGEALRGGQSVCVFSPWTVIAATFRHLRDNAEGILRAVWIPAVASGAVLFLAFKNYFCKLGDYLAHPNAGLASLTVAATGAEMFVWLLLCAVASARLTLVLHPPATPNARRPTAYAVSSRLYAATLRLLFVFCMAAILIGAAAWLGMIAFPDRSGAVAMLSWMAVALVVVILMSRCAFLLPALALYERRGMLRRAWTMTRGRSGAFLLLWTALWLLPAAAVELAGEYMLRPVTEGAVAADMTVLRRAADGLAASDLALVGITGTITLSAMAAMILATVGSCLAYRMLVDRPAKPGRQP